MLWWHLSFVVLYPPWLYFFQVIIPKKQCQFIFEIMIEYFRWVKGLYQSQLLYCKMLIFLCKFWFLFLKLLFLNIFFLFICCLCLWLCRSLVGRFVFKDEGIMKMLVLICLARVKISNIYYSILLSVRLANCSVFSFL